MMYRLTPPFKRLTEEEQHDLWIMIRTLQETPMQPGFPTYNYQREVGDQMMKKYFEEDKKD